MGVASEVVPYSLIGHVINPIEVPSVVSDLHVVLGEVHVVFLVEITL